MTDSKTPQKKAHGEFSEHMIKLDINLKTNKANVSQVFFQGIDYSEEEKWFDIQKEIINEIKESLDQNKLMVNQNNIISYIDTGNSNGHILAQKKETNKSTLISNTNFKGNTLIFTELIKVIDEKSRNDQSIDETKETNMDIGA